MKLPVEIITATTTIINLIILNHWVALVDESVDELVLSIEVSGARGHINLGASDEHLNVSTIWLYTTYPRKRISSLRNLRPEEYLQLYKSSRQTPPLQAHC